MLGGLRKIKLEPRLSSSKARLRLKPDLGDKKLCCFEPKLDLFKDWVKADLLGFIYGLLLLKVWIRLLNKYKKGFVRAPDLGSHVIIILVFSLIVDELLTSTVNR